MHISIDREKGIFFIPRTYFDVHEKRIQQTLKDFIIVRSTDAFVEIRIPNKLSPKMSYDKVFVNGELKEKEKSCTFCKSRIRCITNGWNCTGYLPNPTYNKDKEQTDTLFEDVKLLETKV